jgi:hypothetical protein
MSQHAHLTAVVGFVHDHICDHSRARRPWLEPAVTVKLPDSTLGSESLSQHLRTKRSALRESVLRLPLRAAGAIQPWRRLQVRRRQAKPLAANVMDVGKDSGDGARFAARNLRAPGTRVEMLEHELIHALIDRVGFQHTLPQIRSGRGNYASHIFSSNEASLIQNTTTYGVWNICQLALKHGGEFPLVCC